MKAASRLNLPSFLRPYDSAGPQIAAEGGGDAAGEPSLVTRKGVNIGVVCRLTQFCSLLLIWVKWRKREWEKGFSAGLPLSSFTHFPGKGSTLGSQALLPSFARGKR